MGFRFRKSIKIAPGLKLNISKGGVSLTAGVRGASMSFGKRGTYANVGLPGSGISYRQRLDGPAPRRSTSQTDEEAGLITAQIKLQDDGTVDLLDQFDTPLSGKHKRLFWEQHGEQVVCWLEDQVHKLNAGSELLTSIHLDSINPEQLPRYSEQPFQEQEPARPDKSDQPRIPVLAEPVKPGLLGGLMPGRRARYREDLRRFQEASDNGMARWQEESERFQAEYRERERLWRVAVAQWQQGKLRHGEGEVAKKASYLNDLTSSLPTIETSLEAALSQLVWPRATLVDYSITERGSIVWLDVDLPEIEDLPPRVAKLSTNRKRIIIREKNQKQLRMQYAAHIHGIFFKLACTALAALPACRTVVISGYTQRLNSATGEINDEYLYSVRATPEVLSQTNFENLGQVNPIETMTLFEHRRKMTATGLFKPIEPYAPV